MIKIGLEVGSTITALSAILHSSYDHINPELRINLEAYFSSDDVCAEIISIGESFTVGRVAFEQVFGTQRPVEVEVTPEVLFAVSHLAMALSAAHAGAEVDEEVKVMSDIIKDYGQSFFMDMYVYANERMIKQINNESTNDFLFQKPEAKGPKLIVDNTQGLYVPEANKKIVH